MNKRKALISIGIFIGVGALVVLVLWLVIKPGKDGLLVNDAAQQVTLVDQNALAALPKKDASSADLTHLSDAVVPPTNTWISGAVLQTRPNAVYPMPFSFQPTGSGFQLGVPSVTASQSVITGGHTPDVDATIDGATTFQLTRFDKTSATLTYAQDQNKLGSVTLAQGSPYVFYRAIRDSTITIQNVSGASESGDTYKFTKNNIQYSIALHDKASAQLSGASLTISVPMKSLVTFYALPAGADDVLGEFSANEITSVEVTSETDGDASLTNFEYKTINNQPTIVSFLPYQTIKDGSERAPKYKSIYGDMKSYEGTTFKTTVPLVEEATELDISKLNDAQKKEVITQLQADSKVLKVEPQDTYFASKQLAKIANLLSIAEQLDQDAIASELRATLHTELTKRLDGTYLYYDTKLKGIAGQNAAFGSEDFNDHHFHYGYFIYAASILAKYDDAFYNSYKNQVNLLVADIASYQATDQFPVQRNYDPYSGHAWAAGLSPFQDGNNQESSSEALNAWNAVAAWAKISDNSTLHQTAQWMLSYETNTAQKAWRSVDTSYSYLGTYQEPVAALSFGGKRTYATFFSDESNAKLGIQLIPMSPVMKIFQNDGAGITAKLAAQDKPGDYNVALGDYLLMYLALKDPSAALSAYRLQRDSYIDDGNTRAYTLAWIYSLS